MSSATPGLTASTTPKRETSATPGLEELQVTTRSRGALN